MKRISIVSFLIILLLAACGPAPTAVPTVDINATVSSISKTIVASTLTAQPTATPLPTSTPTPTSTPLPTETVTPTVTSTSQAFVGCFAPSGTGAGPVAPFKIENFTTSIVVVYINGVTRNGDFTLNCSEALDKNDTAFFTLPFGTYKYTVQIGSKKTIQGGFYINDTDKATMQVYDTKIKIGPFP